MQFAEWIEREIAKVTDMNNIYHPTKEIGVDEQVVYCLGPADERPKRIYHVLATVSRTPAEDILLPGMTNWRLLEEIYDFLIMEIAGIILGGKIDILPREIFVDEKISVFALRENWNIVRLRLGEAKT